MAELSTRDVEYGQQRRMIGLLCAPRGAASLPGILLVHDAFGLSDEMIVWVRRYAALGFAVFAADVWGERTTPAHQDEIGPLIGGMVGDRTEWMSRIGAAHTTFAAQPEVDSSRIAAVGYCFGGSSALEYARTGGALRGVVSVHGGLDLLIDDWSTPVAVRSVLLCTGSEDPMATRDQREALQASLDSAGVDWELDLYSGTKHAFTNPSSAASPTPGAVAYNAQSAARAWDATTRFLRELLIHAPAAP